MAKTADELLYDKEEVQPLIRELLDEGLVLVESPHEPGHKPHHRFYMGKTTVSQALWVALMGENPSFYPKNDRNDAELYPVDDVFIDDCLAFIRLLNERPEVKERKLLFRLPEKDEWRFASAAGGASYQTGRHACAKKGIRLEEVAWYKGNPSRFNRNRSALPMPAITRIGSDGIWPRELAPAEIPGPRPMGILKENDFQLFDMYGNLWEWTLEKGAAQGLLFGGSWADGPDACGWKPRSTLPNRGEGVTGLRLVAVRKAGRRKQEKNGV